MSPHFVNTVRHSLKCKKKKKNLGISVAAVTLNKPLGHIAPLQSTSVSERLWSILWFYNTLNPNVNISCVTTMICQHHLPISEEII